MFLTVCHFFNSWGVNRSGYDTNVGYDVICQRDITVVLHGNSVIVLVCLEEEECCNNGLPCAPESLVTVVTVVTMVTMCSTGSRRLCQ